MEVTLLRPRLQRDPKRRKVLTCLFTFKAGECIKLIKKVTPNLTTEIFHLSDTTRNPTRFQYGR